MSCSTSCSPTSNKRGGPVDEYGEALDEAEGDLLIEVERLMERRTSGTSTAFPNPIPA